MAGDGACVGHPLPPPPHHHHHLGLQLRFPPLLPLKWDLPLQQVCHLGDHIGEAEPGPKDGVGEHLPSQPVHLPQHLHEGGHGGHC